MLSHIKSCYYMLHSVSSGKEYSRHVRTCLARLDQVRPG
jgi:hypothetical protein